MPRSIGQNGLGTAARRALHQGMLGVFFATMAPPSDTATPAAPRARPRRAAGTAPSRSP